MTRIKKLNMKTYDIIYSIGCDCACSLYLKKNGLRAYSGPFDWLTYASFEDRFTYLLNDFNDFFNYEDFIPLEKDLSITNDDTSDYYHNKRTNFYFYHDFPSNESFDSSFPVVKQKYERRIKRFYESIKNNDRILLVWFSHYHHTNDDNVVYLCSEFIKKIGKPIDFLIIENIQDKEDSQIKIKEITKNITRANIHTIALDATGNITTLGNETACNTIFSEYNLNISSSVKVQRVILTTIVKLVCLFIPTKKSRRKFRKNLIKW